MKTPKRNYCCFSRKKIADENHVEQSKHNEARTPDRMTLESKQSLHSQKVPSTTQLTENLRTGHVILLKGKPLANCTRFAVNLVCGSSENADIAFHFNPRMDREYVVRNSFLRGHWNDEEETTSLIHSDFQRDKVFELAIFVADRQFMVAVNGRDFCSYTFRTPLTAITAVDVLGAVDVYSLEIKEWTSYPPKHDLNVPLDSELEDQSRTDIASLSMPYSGHLINGFQTHWKLEICGRVKLLPHTFFINLQDGSQLWPHPLIHLHLNPRFNWMEGKDVFVRNAWLDGKWGNEERTHSFPFIPGSNFALIIEKTIDHFSVWVDKVLIGEFKFRAATDGINTVDIKGDIVLHKIIMHDRTNS